MPTSPITTKSQSQLTAGVTKPEQEVTPTAIEQSKPADTAKKSFKAKLQAFSRFGKSAQKAASKTEKSALPSSFASAESPNKSRTGPSPLEAAALKSSFSLSPKKINRPAAQASIISTPSKNAHTTSQKPVLSRQISKVSYQEQTTEISTSNELKHLQLRLDLLKQSVDHPTLHDKAMNKVMTSQHIDERDRVLTHHAQRSKHVSTVNFQGVTAEVSKDTELKILQIRNALLKMSPASTQSFQKSLVNALSDTDAGQRTRLIADVSKQVVDHLNKFEKVEFKGVTTEIPKAKIPEFMQMRLNLLNLPDTTKRQKYTALIQDTLLNKNQQRRESFLTEIAAQIADEVRLKR
jgi:hypothetical protein